MKLSSHSFLNRLVSNPARFAFLLAGLLLSGCATKSADTSFAFTPETETGLIVGSASSAEENSWYDAAVRFRYAIAGRQDSFGNKGGGFIEALPNHPLLGPSGPSDFADATGTLFAIPLPPGDYVFHEWDIDNGSNAIIYPIDPKPLPFTVKKGEATYIGNLHMHLRTGRNILGITIIADGQPAITDRSERDIPLLLERYANLKREDIVIRVIDDRPWGGKGPPARIEAQLAN